MKTIIVLVSLFLIITGLGCAALSNYVTPAKIDKGAIDYVVTANVAEVEDYLGYPSLFKATKLQKDVDAAHNTIQLWYEQKIQKDNLTYSIHKNVVSNNVTVGLQREEMLFGKTGLLSLGLSMAGFGTLTGLIGLMRKRPGDVTQVEMEQALATMQGETSTELAAKNRQFAQLVKGIQEFMDTYKTVSPTVIMDLKNTFDKTQDTDTQIAVSAVKKG